MKKNFSILAATIILMFTATDVSALDYLADLSISVAEQYNDNIGLSQSHKTGDFLTVVNPSVVISTTAEKGDAMINYSPSFNVYAREDDRNSISHQAAITGRYRFSDTLIFNLSEAFTQSQESSVLRTVEGGGPITSDRRIITSNSLGGVLDYRLSGLIGLQVGAAHNLVNVAGTNLGDYQTYSGRLGANYILNERITLRVGAAYTLFDYKMSGDATTMDYTLGANWRLTPTITLDGYGGLVITRLEQEGRTVNGFSYGLSVAKRFERGAATIAYAHGVTAGIQSTSPLRSHVLTFRYDMPITTQMNAAVSAFYGNYRTMGDTGDNLTANRDEYGGAINIAYRLWRDLSAIMSYSYVKSSARSNITGSYTNNIIMIGLRFGKQVRF
jgi:hypothetical protein